MSVRFLTALPVYNERASVDAVLDEVVKTSPDVLVVDDGSSDGTADLLAGRRDVAVVRHAQNRGYGAALRTAFAYAAEHDFQTLVTIDCDGQHEPQRIPGFVDACAAADVDIVSGSRYLKHFQGDSAPPADRRRVNERITAEINRRLGLTLTDAFCGFKAYRVSALTQLHLTEDGYAMPLELWVQAACRGLRVIELPVPLIYLDASRSFGGALDDAVQRMEHYRQVLDRSIALAREVAPAGSRCAGAAG
ncbi:MAG: glycosyltransferase family 2 protein [Planctomycetales bacterium]|nr:glycosyltransferase family 2 protein [Planctomycetales bacterium]